MGIYTGANKAFSTAPYHPVPTALVKISTDVFYTTFSHIHPSTCQVLTPMK